MLTVLRWPKVDESGRVPWLWLLWRRDIAHGGRREVSDLLRPRDGEGGRRKSSVEEARPVLDIERELLPRLLSCAVPGKA